MTEFLVRGPAGARTAASIREEARRAQVLADQLAHEAGRAQQAEIEATRPRMPEIEAGEPGFLTFTKYMSGREYTYAAVGWKLNRGSTARFVITHRAEGSRYTASSEGNGRFTWEGLLAFIGEANWGSLRVLVPGEAIVAPGGLPPVVETIGSFGQVLGTHRVPDSSTGGDPYQ